MPLGVEKVHRTALAARATGDLAEKLGHAGVCFRAARQRMGVIAIGRNDRVVVIEHGNRADGDRFLAIVKVAKTPDLALRERLLRLFLEATDDNHLAEEIDFLLRLQIGKSG